MASQKQLEGTRVTRKCDSNTKVLHPHLQGWLQEDNVLTYQGIAPTFTRVVARGQCPYRPTITPK